ncbi:uncharacterized protein [Dermacentor andersoni]|uniref:uncharacterized protein n=1 Tax=Dermacentor andersoni TaxID=34620 RepID=UPI003B3ACA8B
MHVMNNTLGKRAQTQPSGQAPAAASSPASPSAPEATPADKDTSDEMVVSCCRFLCYFCRTSRQNLSLVGQEGYAAGGALRRRHRHGCGHPQLLLLPCGPDRSVRPEAATIAQGKNESIRARAILRSLEPLDDLLGVLRLHFTLQIPRKGDTTPKADLPAGLQPNHKQSIVMFLERVYGLETQETFFRLLEDGFLPDVRAAAMLDRPAPLLRVPPSSLWTHGTIQQQYHEV